MTRLFHPAKAALALCFAATACSSSPASTVDAGSKPQAAPGAKCDTTRDCSSSDDAPQICARATHQCTNVFSEDCRSVTGPWRDESAVWIGSLFSLSGSQAATNLARRDSAALAVERVNSLGGIPRHATGVSTRPLVMLTCDESQSLTRAASHLIRDLGIAAIVGPNTSQDTIDLAQDLSIREGALLITPTAMATDIAHLLDDDLVWQMVPTTEQRAPWLLRQVEALAADIARTRGGVRLALAYRDDVLGVGLRSALSQLQLNGKPLADPENLGNRVRIDAYDPSRSDQAALVAAYAAFRPDIVVLAGTTETVSDILAPLERAWDTGQGAGPEYVLSDSSKVPELLELARDAGDLRARIHGLGNAPSVAAQPVFDAVASAYRARFPTEPADISGIGSAYDAACALVFGIAASGEANPTGAGIARGLRSLASGTRQARTDQLEDGLPIVAAGDAPDLLGTLGPLRWDQDGVVLGATLDTWCLVADDTEPSFQSSGWTYDIGTQSTAGAPTQCAGWAPSGTPPPATQPDTTPPVAPPSAAQPPAADEPPPDTRDAGPPEGSSEDAATQPPPDAAPPAPDPPPVLVVQRRDNEWADGYCDSIGVVNVLPTDLTWSTELTIDGTITDFWNCAPSGRAGSVVFRGADWNRTLEPFADTSFGFCASRP